MFRNLIMLCTAAILVCAAATSSSSASEWEVVGSLTDPCNTATTDYLDITEARVEKNGTQLKFIMLVAGNIPGSTPAWGDDIVFLWLVDADNNSNTGQSVGNEFNVRAWVGNTGIGGYVDVVGQWGGVSGPGVTTITGNKVEIVIDMAQIMSPDLFHFRCDTFETSGGTYYPGNGVTGESIACWASRYAVLMDPNYLGFGVESNMQIYKCDPSDPLNTATGTLWVDKSCNIHDSLPVFNTMEGHGDGDTPGVHQIFGQTMGVCSLLHVRDEAVLDINTPDAGAYGQIEAKAAGYQGFRLLGRDGDTGPIPHGMFLLDLRHSYHVRGIEADWKVDAQSYAQIVINDINDGEYIQKTVWGNGHGGTNDTFTCERMETIDLADMEMEFDRRYAIDTLVLDTCRTSDPSYATYLAQVAGHSDLIATFRMVHPLADVNADRSVDFKDMAVLAAEWLTEK